MTDWKALLIADIIARMKTQAPVIAKIINASEAELSLFFDAHPTPSTEISSTADAPAPATKKTTRQVIAYPEPIPIRTGYENLLAPEPAPKPAPEPAPKPKPPRINRSLQAYNLCRDTGKPWAEIAELVGFKTGHHAYQAAYKHAQHHNKVWPLPDQSSEASKTTTAPATKTPPTRQVKTHTDDNDRAAYELRRDTGLPWSEIAKRLNAGHHTTAYRRAEAWALQNSLPWPLSKKAGKKTRKPPGKGERAYNLRRDTGLPWSEIAKQSGHRTSNAACKAALNYANYYRIAWPVPQTPTVVPEPTKPIEEPDARPVKENSRTAPATKEQPRQVQASPPPPQTPTTQPSPTRRPPRSECAAYLKSIFGWDWDYVAHFSDFHDAQAARRAADSWWKANVGGYIRVNVKPMSQGERAYTLAFYTLIEHDWQEIGEILNIPGDAFKVAQEWAVYNHKRFPWSRPAAAGGAR